MEQAPKLLDQVRQRIRFKHYSIRSERSYVDRIRRFIVFHGKRHPKDMGAREVKAFPTHLPVQRSVAASTRNRAVMTLLLFIFPRDVLVAHVQAGSAVSL
ncbi:MAG: phage integrase N-terminal SAM-like domain-containing protein [Ectothiorhodospiraceae bacterium]|nr:phage integrase N-terminal SAM-like domain-containing protein [Ectothiorhodospiraceae bacterium]